MESFDASTVKRLGKHCSKRRNCTDSAISPFPTMFSDPSEKQKHFFPLLNLSSANPFNLEKFKIALSGNGLIEKGQTNEPKYGLR